VHWSTTKEAGNLGWPQDDHGVVYAATHRGGGDDGGEAAGLEEVHGEEGVAIIVDVVDYEDDYADGSDDYRGDYVCRFPRVCVAAPIQTHQEENEPQNVEEQAYEV